MLPYVFMQEKINIQEALYCPCVVSVNIVSEDVRSTPVNARACCFVLSIFICNKFHHSQNYSADFGYSSLMSSRKHLIEFLKN